jgi:CRP/FNR family cyclic AMP-dependent transcriptional regulator
MASQLTGLDPKEFAGVLDVLRKIDFLGGVQDAELKSMLLSLQKQSYPKNSTVLFQGEIANSLFIIRKGSVSISTKNKGTKIALAELKAPQYFGEISLLRPTSATATVTTGEEGADVLILTHEAMSSLRKKIPDIDQRIQQVIDTRIAAKQKAKDLDNQT